MGDVVLLKDTALLTRTWPMAVIVQVISGKQGHTRVVDLRIHRKIYRSTDHLFLLLPVTENSHDRGEYVGDSIDPRQPLQLEEERAGVQSVNYSSLQTYNFTKLSHAHAQSYASCLPNLHLSTLYNDHPFCITFGQ